MMIVVLCMFLFLKIGIQNSGFYLSDAPAGLGELVFKGFLAFFTLQNTSKEQERPGRTGRSRCDICVADRTNPASVHHSTVVVGCIAAHQIMSTA